MDSALSKVICGSAPSSGGCCGPGRQLRDARVRRPLQPPEQQPATLATFDPKHLAERLFSRPRCARRFATAHAHRRVRGQPGTGVLELVGVLGAWARPRRMRDHHTVLAAFSPAAPRCLQISLRRADVQGAPATDTVPAVVTRAASPTPRTPPRHRRLRPHRERQYLTRVPGSAPRRLQLHRHVLDDHVRSLSPTTNTPDMRNSVHLLRFEPSTVQNLSRTRCCTLDHQVTDPLQRHNRPCHPSRAGRCFRRRDFAILIVVGAVRPAGGFHRRA